MTDCEVDQVEMSYHEGDDNVSDIDQYCYGNFASALQNGNLSTITQDGAANQFGYVGSMNQAWVHQDGNNNYSNVD